MTDLDSPMSQADFAAIVGVSQQTISDYLSRGIFPREATGGQWLLVYCARLREQAAGRGQELTIERAALSREQRLGQEIKNRVALGQYAPIGLLGDVLALASAAVVDRFDALPGQLRKVCPSLPSEARDAIVRTIASARNEWIRSTAELVVNRIDEAYAEPLCDDDEVDLDLASSAEETDGIDNADDTTSVRRSL